MKIALLKKNKEKKRSVLARVAHDRKLLMSKIARPGKISKKAIRKPRIHY